MSSNQVNQQDLKFYEEIKTILSQRDSSYEKVLAKFFVGDNGQGWKNIITTFTVLAKDAKYTPQEMNYGNAVYVEKILTNLQLIDILGDLTRESRLQVPDRLNIEVKGRFDTNPHLAYTHSNDQIFNLEWPSNVYQFRQDGTPNIPFGPFVSLENPLYPDYLFLMEDKFGLNRTHYYEFFGSVLVFLPNYKAKIMGLRLDTKQLVISTRKNVSDDLVAKVFLTDSVKLEKPEVRISDSQTTIPLGFIPSRIEVHILSAKTGEKLDFRSIQLNWPAPSGAIDLEIANEDILQLISRGESDRTEFKQDINKNTDRFVHTVVAFANTNGGTVFIGVNDAGEISGSYDQKLEETIQNTIRSNCEPTIKLKIENRAINDRNIVVVSVMEGNDKPYTYRGKGVFVRRGSTNRIASRYELDEFYKMKQNNMPRSGLG